MLEIPNREPLGTLNRFAIARTTACPAPDRASSDDIGLADHTMAGSQAREGSDRAGSSTAARPGAKAPKSGGQR